MPLVTISGLPLSGKTKRAKELKSFLLENLKRDSKSGSIIRNVILVNEEELEIDKKTAYIDADSEKKVRGRVLSAIERHLCREDIVICDYLNYIKGFRYQLYVIARNIGTPTCTIHCGDSLENALEINENIDRYDRAMLGNLCSRFEEPDGRNRWDAPLYTLIKTDESLETSQTAQDILLSLTKKAPNPNLSTVVKPIFDTNYLAKTDKCLGDIIDCLIDAQKNQRSGDILVPNATNIVCIPSRFISLSEFRRLKRQYLHLNKSHTIFEVGAIANAFVDYINSNFSDSE